MGELVCCWSVIDLWHEFLVTITSLKDRKQALLFEILLGLMFGPIKYNRSCVAGSRERHKWTNGVYVLRNEHGIGRIIA